jgi:hypothetical protein
MVVRPAAVIFVNDDLTTGVKNMFITQLHITESMSGTTFDARLVSDPDYVTKVKQLDVRLLVIRSLEENINRDYADVVAFYKAGLVSILQNKLGPPGRTYKLVNLDWGDLCVFS